MAAAVTSVADGLDRLGLTRELAPRLSRFVGQLERWNRVYNLTAVRDLETMVVRHLFDSLAIGPWLRGPRILDVGSGAGLPGIPLAIAYPALHFYLLDSNGKRTRFMTQMVAELELTNVRVIRARIEAYRADQPFTTITARAFAAPQRLLVLARRLCAAEGQVLAMQSNAAAEAPPGWRLVADRHLEVPGLQAARRLLQYAPQPNG